MPIYRVDFHHHVKGDPVDFLHYTAIDLIDAAVVHRIDVLAITPHGVVFHDPQARAYAEQKGVLLIFGVEKRIEGKEVLLLNVIPDEIPAVMSFADLKRLRAQKGEELLVVAPHPFYPTNSCMGEAMDSYADLLDGVEYAHLHLPFYNPNDRAVEWARERGKPLLANSDTHSLFMIGRNYSEVESDDLRIESIFKAIRSRRCQAIVHIPSLWEVFRFLMEISVLQALIRLVIPSRIGDPFAQNHKQKMENNL